MSCTALICRPRRASITPEKKELLISTVKRFAAEHPSDKILIGRADFSTTPPSTPSHELLDEAVVDRPVVIHNTSERALWLNVAAIKLAGLTDRPVSDPVEEKGVIRDASGHPSGILLEAAMQIAARAISSLLPEKEQLPILAAGIQHLNSSGITTVVNATGSLAEIRMYAALRDRGELTIRTRTAFGDVAVPHRLTPQFLAEIEEARQKYHDKWVSSNLIKLFADGSTGMIPPLVYDPLDYQKLILELDRRGFQIMTHAIRDDSIHMVLDAYQKLEQTNGLKDRRLRIEHLDQAAEVDLERLTPLSVVSVMETAFCCGADGYNFDASHMLPIDRWKTVIDSGAGLAFGSDWPCTGPPSPFIAIQQAVTRSVWKSADTDNVAGQPLDGAAQGGARETGAVYVPTERITVEQAVNAYTRNAAHAALNEAWSGSLETGKEADLVVLSQDIFSVPAERIGSTRVVQTMVGGKIVYRAQ
jgi:predicted amidohydrolase YtcJ